MKKTVLTFALFLLCVITVFAQRYSGIVNDPDGYANVRSKPTTKSSILDQKTDGDLIFYTPMSNGWSKVYEQDDIVTFIGYMSTSRIQRVNISEMSDPPEEYGLKLGKIVDPEDSYVNIRKGPGTNYAIVGRLNIGTQVLYKPVNSKWMKIYNKVSERFLGYVASSRIY